MTITTADIKVAIRSVRSTRWRSLLTTSGIIIGIVSVITIVSIGKGIQNQVSGQINHLGKDLITIRPGSIVSSFQSLNPFSSSNYTVGSLSSRDEKVVSETPGVGATAPMSIVPGSIQSGSKSFDNIVVIGTSSQAPQILNQSLQYGAFFTPSTDVANVAILGQGAANALFPGEVPLGLSFTLDGQQFIVRGEFNQFDIAPLSLDTNFNDAIFIPYKTAQSIENNSAPIYEILAKPSNPGQTNNVAATIKEHLLVAHGGIQDFSVLRQQDSLAATNNILNLLTKLITGIATVSLLVGGIGVMNIMLVSVTERTHEIGIRKAIGATNRQILNQFLIESTILSLFGGIIGVILSLLINVVLRTLTSLQPALSWEVTVIATGVAIIIGIIFGITPAVKAARRNPIDALRYYQ